MSTSLFPLVINPDGQRQTLTIAQVIDILEERREEEAQRNLPEKELLKKERARQLYQERKRADPDFLKKQAAYHRSRHPRARFNRKKVPASGVTR